MKQGGMKQGVNTRETKALLRNVVPDRATLRGLADALEPMADQLMGTGELIRLKLEGIDLASVAPEDSKLIVVLAETAAYVSTTVLQIRSGGIRPTKLGPNATDRDIKRTLAELARAARLSVSQGRRAMDYLRTCEEPLETFTEYGRGAGGIRTSREVVRVTNAAKVLPISVQTTAQIMRRMAGLIGALERKERETRDLYVRVTNAR